MPDDSYQLLKQFFESHPVAQKATAPLKRGAEVAVHFTDLPGRTFRFYKEDDAPRLTESSPQDADFDLTLAPLAVQEIVALEGHEVGDFGIAFFSHLIASEPERKVQVKLHAGPLKLLRRGYLGVLVLGGPKVLGWLARKGVKNPMEAIERLRKP